MLIELEKIKWKNFISYGNKWSEVDLLPGINIVLGKDVDSNRSNGSGKSSYLETISFALYGKILKEVKKVDIVNWKNGKNCEVVLYFKRGNDNYIVERGIKPDIFNIYCLLYTSPSPRDRS